MHRLGEGLSTLVLVHEPFVARADPCPLSREVEWRNRRRFMPNKVSNAGILDRDFLAMC